MIKSPDKIKSCKENNFPTVLSSKILTAGQRELLLNRAIGVVERNFISITPIPFQITELPDNLIFTSKNTVRVLMEHPLWEKIRQKRIFCVGEKTAQYMKSKGFNIVLFKNYGQQLACEIIRTYPKEKFLFFSGKQRHYELPDGLKDAGVHLSEIAVYDTLITPKKIDRIFDGVLFFSPSAVESYCTENDLSQSIAFCIGKTTSKKAQKYTDRIVVATTPSIENVIVQVVNYLAHPRKKI